MFNGTNIDESISDKMKDWLWLFRVFILIGVTIFTIGQLAGTPDGEYAAYIWFTVGILATWIVSLRIIAKKSSGGQSMQDIKTGVMEMLPNIGTLIPLVLMIYISSKVKHIIEANYNNLPGKYFWFNKFVFFLIVLQLFTLHKFYDGGVGDKKTYPTKGIYMAVLLLLSILSTASAVELYVITTSFITDG
tara:strand:- start:10660 stop:11229 length:570 start_codon:yes stop_codon:yes gene_type:complete